MTAHWIKPDWPAAPGVMAVSTLRTGGVSDGDFASNNLGAHVGDQPLRVQANRQLLAQRLQLPAEPIWLNQVHGTKVVDAGQTPPGARADGSYTKASGIVCTVMTADCLPLLLSGSDGRMIAAVHCGWRGLLAGIIAAAVKHFNDADIIAWLGPAIGPAAFEVGPEVRQNFIDKHEAYRKAFVEHGQDKWLADIYALARIDLAGLAVTRVYGGDHCTFTETERFFSYRRQARTGRMATLIWRQD